MTAFDKVLGVMAEQERRRVNWYKNASDNAAAELDADPRYRTPADTRQEAREIAENVSRRMGRDPAKDAQLRAAMNAARQLGERGRYEPTEADLKAQRMASLQAEVREYLVGKAIARIKIDCNPWFEHVGLHLTRIPNWRPA